MSKSNTEACKGWCHWTHMPADFRHSVRQEWVRSSETQKVALCRSWVFGKRGVNRVTYSLDGKHRMCLKHVCETVGCARRRVVKMVRAGEGEGRRPFPGQGDVPSLSLEDDETEMIAALIPMPFSSPIASRAPPKALLSSSTLIKVEVLGGSGAHLPESLDCRRSPRRPSTLKRQSEWQSLLDLQARPAKRLRLDRDEGEEGDGSLNDSTTSLSLSSLSSSSSLSTPSDLEAAALEALAALAMAL